MQSIHSPFLSAMTENAIFYIYTVTHEQVTRSAPSLILSDKKIPYVNTKGTENLNAVALPAKKGNKLRKANEEKGEVSLVRLIQ